MKTAYAVVTGFIVMLGIIAFFVAVKTADAPAVDVSADTIDNEIQASSTPELIEPVEPEEVESDMSTSLPPGFTVTPPPLLEASPVETSTDTLIGLTWSDAQAYATTEELVIRVGAIDGQPQMVTMDYRPGRITVSLVDDIVVDYTVE